jgi:pSer/pThr/pTyr-binding forkhead associated (FHA) protein
VAQGKTPQEAGPVEEMKSLHLFISESGQQRQLPPAAEILVGRLDATHGIFPDLDLTADGGLEKGVSRRHAKIMQWKGEFFIEDLGSANGTFLNEERLTPYLPYSLQNGDNVQVGRVKMQVSWEE